MEEDKRRQERNERILRVLERIQNRAAALAAKTERFELLRKQYHAFLQRSLSNKVKSENVQYSQLPPTMKSKFLTKTPTPQQRGINTNHSDLVNSKIQFVKDYLHNLPNSTVGKSLVTINNIPNINLTDSSNFHSNDLIPDQLSNKQVPNYISETLQFKYSEPTFSTNNLNCTEESHKITSESCNNERTLFVGDNLSSVRALKNLSYNEPKYSTVTTAIDIKRSENYDCDLENNSLSNSEKGSVFDVPFNKNQYLEKYPLLNKTCGSLEKVGLEFTNLVPDYYFDTKKDDVQHDGEFNNSAFLNAPSTSKTLINYMNNEKIEENLMNIHSYPSNLKDIINNQQDTLESALNMEDMTKNNKTELVDSKQLVEEITNASAEGQLIKEAKIYPKINSDSAETITYKQKDNCSEKDSNFDTDKDNLVFITEDHDNEIGLNIERECGLDSLHDQKEPVEMKREDLCNGVKSQIERVINANTELNDNIPIHVNENELILKHNEQIIEETERLITTSQVDQPISVQNVNYPDEDKEQISEGDQKRESDGNKNMINAYAESISKDTYQNKCQEDENNELEDEVQFCENDQISECNETNDKFIAMPEVQIEEHDLSHVISSENKQENEESIKRVLECNDDRNAIVEQFDDNEQDTLQNSRETVQSIIPRCNEQIHLLPECDEVGQFTTNYEKNDFIPTRYQENPQSVIQNVDNETLLIESGRNLQSVPQSYENNQHDIEYNEDNQNISKSALECENDPDLAQYYEKSQHITQHDDDQSVTKYDESIHNESDRDKIDIQAVNEYSENDQPIRYNDNNQYMGQYCDSDQSVIQYDENNQPIIQYDENGQPIYQFEDTNQPIIQYDVNGQPIYQYENMSQPIIQYDENGQPIVQYDENGQPVYEYEDTNQPPIQYDENGQPVYQYEDTNQSTIQYDESGQPVYEYNQENQYFDNMQYNNEGQVDHLKYENQEEIPQQPTENESNTFCNSARQINVMDVLETDTESLRQETKASNDSDFEFSNN